MDIKVIQRPGKRPVEELYVEAAAEGTGESVESETRPKAVIHVTVHQGGQLHNAKVEVRVLRSANQKVKVYSEHRVRQETIDYSTGTERYTELWRSDKKPIKFHLEIREGTPPPSLDEWQWQGPGLPKKKIKKLIDFDQEEPESSVSDPDSS